MELLIENAVSFQKSIEAISVLVDEAEFDLNEDGLLLKATDPSQIAMIDFELAKKDFKEFKVEPGTKLAVDLDFLGSVLNRAKASDSLKITLNETKSKLMVHFLGKTKRVFEIPLIDITSSKLPNPKIDFDAEIKLKAEALKDGLKDAALVSTHITLGVDAEKFFLKANSSKGTLNNEISTKEKKFNVEIKAKSEAKSMFPLDYLSDMLKAASNDTEITVKLKSNAPIQISYIIDKAKINYFLAPRIESE